MFTTLEGWWPALTAHHDRLVIAGGGLCLLLGVLVWRWWRRGAAHTRVGVIAIVLATLFAAEGMWEVARLSMHLNVVQAIALFALFEVVMVHQGLSAKYKMRRDPPRPVRRHLNIIWAVAAASGVVSSLRADSAAEFVVRLIAPSVAAMIFWMDLTTEKDVADSGKITWRFKPLDLAVRVGLAEPGEHGVAEADQRRRLDKMALLAHRLHNSRLDQKTRDKVVARLAKLSLNASDATLAEVQRRVSRASKAEELTQPNVLKALTGAAADPPPQLAGPATAPAMVLSAARTAPGEERATGTVRPSGPAVPRKADAYRQWLQVWQAMQAHPRATNKVLAAQHPVAERTITAIRAAGRSGMLTVERLQELELELAATEDPGPVSPAPASPASRPGKRSGPPQDDRPRPRLGPQTSEPAPVTDEAGHTVDRSRNAAMVG